MLPSQMLKARFCIVTPMFLGDADQKASSIRPPSLKGALRFWWRALNWSGFLKQADQNEAAALQALHKEEARLFGTTAAEKTGGQGVFLLTITKDETKFSSQTFKSNSPEICYLLGIGLIDKPRNFINEKSTFRAELLFRPKTNARDQKSVADALYVFGLLGALGSRARHGMGSVSLIGWEGGEPRTVPKTEDEYKKAIRDLLGPEAEQAAALPPFTAFSQKSQIWLSAKGAFANDLLIKVGEQQMLYRSYGHKGKVVLNENKTKTVEVESSDDGTKRPRFAKDHDLLLSATKNEKITTHPKRVVFGLPHNYFFSSTQPKAKLDVNYAPKGQDARRASPLSLHIHRLTEDQFLAVHVLLPAMFLPPGASIRIFSRTPRLNPLSVSTDVDWAVLTDYLKRKSFTQDKIYG